MVGRHRPWGLPTLLARAAAWPCHLAGLGVQPRSMSAVLPTRPRRLGAVTPRHRLWGGSPPPLSLPREHATPYKNVGAYRLFC